MHYCNKVFFTSLVFFVVAYNCSNAQNNNGITLLDSSKSDTAKSVVIRRAHSPKTATYLSMALPGAGQVFNKKYWKVPIIYAGFATGIYFNRIFNSKYNEFKAIYNDHNNPYKAKNKTIPTDTLIRVAKYNYPVSISSVIEFRNYYRKYRDITIIAMSLWYVLNVVDASVDAYFFDYEMSDNLSLHIKPSLYYLNNKNYSLGVSLRLYSRK